jgi:uncharacterized NAD(P)/FAD-binding protein YdhS
VSNLGFASLETVRANALHDARQSWYEVDFDSVGGSPVAEPCGLVDQQQAPVELAVIGGGAAAVAALLSWQQRPCGARPQLLWIAPDAGGAGVAYATRDPQHRLNVRARRMSALETRPEDFVEYLRERDGQVDPDGFYPRSDYADYLRTRLAAVLQERDCEHWQTEAATLERIDGGWQILGRDGQWRLAQAVILAPGAVPPRALRGVAPELIMDGRYRLDPWRFAVKPDPLPRRPVVWIVGSGLTAVDLALTAARQYPDANIHLLSRHGRLPAVQTLAHALPAEPAAALLTRLEGETRMSRIVALVRQSMRMCADWRSVMETLRPATSALWRGLPRSERLRFLRHARSLWDVSRHRMAPEIDAQLRALAAQGRLTVHAGRLISARPADAGAAVLAWRPRGSDITCLQRAERVLQACGLDNRVDADAPELLAGLLESGQVRADAHALGLDVDAANALVDALGRTHSDLWLLGALTQGSLWEATAIPDIRVHAERVVSAAQARPLTRQQIARSASRRGLRSYVG